MVLLDLEVAARVRHRQRFPRPMFLLHFNCRVVFCGKLKWRRTGQFLHLLGVGFDKCLLLGRVDAILVLDHVKLILTWGGEIHRLDVWLISGHILALSTLPLIFNRYSIIFSLWKHLFLRWTQLP